MDPMINFDLKKGHSWLKYKKKFSLAIKNNKNVEIWGTGKCKRELIICRRCSRCNYFFFTKKFDKKKIPGLI